MSEQKPYMGLGDFEATQFRHSSRDKADYAYRVTLFDITVLPNEIVFLETPVTEQSEIKQIVLKNTGTKDLTVTEIVTTGDFEIEQIGDEELILKKGEYIVFSVKFVPKRAGEISGSVFFKTKDTTGTDFVKLNGVGVSSSIELTLNYGEVITFDEEVL